MPDRMQIGARRIGAPATRIDGYLAAHESLLQPAVDVVVGEVPGRAGRLHQRFVQ